MNLTVVLMLLTQIEAADPRVAEFVASTDRQVEVLMTPDGEFDAVLAKADGGPAAFDHYSDLSATEQRQWREQAAIALARAELVAYLSGSQIESVQKLSKLLVSEGETTSVEVTTTESLRETTAMFLKRSRVLRLVSDDSDGPVTAVVCVDQSGLSDSISPRISAPSLDAALDHVASRVDSASFPDSGSVVVSVPTPERVDKIHMVGWAPMKSQKTHDRLKARMQANRIVLERNNGVDLSSLRQRTYELRDLIVEERGKVVEEVQDLIVESLYTVSYAISGQVKTLGVRTVDRLGTNIHVSGVRVPNYGPPLPRVDLGVFDTEQEAVAAALDWAKSQEAGLVPRSAWSAVRGRGRAVGVAISCGEPPQDARSLWSDAVRFEAEESALCGVLAGKSRPTDGDPRPIRSARWRTSPRVQFSQFDNCLLCICRVDSDNLRFPGGES